ncbi:MAG TPA: hypothetical protein VJN70_11310 [Gemmatimonadaceae bacterium]|nr:hypothetical protein [Gemmatimonadaceae bacterium]
MTERKKFGFTDRGARIVFRLIEDSVRQSAIVGPELEALLRCHHWSIWINDQPPVECAGLPPVALPEHQLRDWYDEALRRDAIARPEREVCWAASCPHCGRPSLRSRSNGEFQRPKLSEWRCAPCQSSFLVPTDHVFYFDRTYNRRLHDEEVELDE